MARSVYYLTTGPGVGQGLAEQSRIPSETEEACYCAYRAEWQRQRRVQEAGYRVSKKPNCRSRQRADLRQRLYVEEEEEAEREPVLLDIDPEYFRVKGGREQVTMRGYLEDTRAILKTRLLEGCVRDEAMRLRERQLQEQTKIQEANAQYSMYLDTFDTFLAQDQESSAELLHQLQGQVEQSKQKNREIKALNKQLGVLKYRVCVLEEQWGNSRMFQGFLYMVSPMFWRQKHDHVNIRPDDSLSNNLSEMLDKYRVVPTGSAPSVETLQAAFLKDMEAGQEPGLYFKQPGELNAVFKALELQNLNSLLHVEELAGTVRAVHTALEETGRLFEAETVLIQDKIRDLQDASSWEEARTESLGKKARGLINGIFKGAVVAESSLRLLNCVEDVYETCIAKNDGNLGLYDMTQAAEAEMQALLLQLDQLPCHVVKATEQEVYQQNALLMREAVQADCELKSMLKLQARLARSLAPAREPRRGKKLFPRSEPPRPSRRLPPPEAPLTEEQRNFLEYFTEFCHHTDDPKSYLALKQ